MSILSRIRTLANIYGTNISYLEKALGFGEGVIKSWRVSEPSAYKIKKVAQYFHTTTDYLLELTESPTVFYPTAKVSGKKLELLLRLQDMDLSDEQSEIIIGYLDEIENFSHLNKSEVK